jgi:hypothetical protein
MGEGDAALAHGFVEVFNSLEVAVDEWLVDEGPQMLGGLQLGTVGGLEYEPDAVWNDEVLGPMPASIVELQHNAPLAPRTDRPGEVGEHELEVCLADVVGDVPHRLARRRLDEARHVEPLEAVMTDRHGALTNRRPYTARDRLQADAMLVRGPDLDRRARMLAPLLRSGASELFLSAARSSSVAAAGWRGRGCWME